MKEIFHWFYRRGTIKLLKVILIGMMMITEAVGQDKQVFSDRVLRNEIFDDIIAHDVNLVNGILYNYPYPNVKGSPYLFDNAQTGTLTLNGQNYDNQAINLDIYNNQLILNHHDEQHGMRSIIMVREWIESFSINQMLFRSVDFEDGISRYVQVIYEEKELSCYFHWNKEMKLDNTSQQHSFYFTAPSRVIIINRGNNQHLVTSKRSFIKIYDKKHRPALRKIIKSKKIRFRKVSASALADFLAASNHLK